MSTADERAEWKALAEAATEGPWEAEDAGSYVDESRVWTRHGDVMVCLTYSADDPDARFIAAARTAVPSLLAEVERLREGIEALRLRVLDPTQTVTEGPLVGRLKVENWLRALLEDA